MKIGILTQPLHSNYGGLIQNYALQQILIRLGHNPITLDQKEKNISKLRRVIGRMKGWFMYFIDSKHNKKPRYKLTVQEDKVIRKYSISFIEKYIRHSNLCAGSKDFRTESEKLGIEGYVVGSDQCWRPCYNMYLKDMFLDFCKDINVKKRITYAVSFGSDKWEYTETETNECAKLVKLFDSITVREESGVKLCKEYLGADAIHVVDPTLLLERKDYEALIKECGVGESKGQLFNYVLDPSPIISCFIDKVAEGTGYHTFQVLPKYNEDHRTKYDVKKRIKDCIYPSPLVWLRAFMDAKMTIVDSFHGTVFSIIFNKPFWVVGNKERGMSRFISLLSMFGLEDRLICEEDIDKIDYKKPVNWNRVNAVLAEKRKESLLILQKSLE